MNSGPPMYPSPSPDVPVQPGDVLAGKYRVERVLGAGGMGVVVVATHLQLEQRVALKFLLPAAMQHAYAVERFAREARAAVRIHSEHVARVTDVGTLETGAPFMVMEYLEGHDLGQELLERGPLPFDEAIDYILQALEAIAEAHAAGIVHRDLKPANLFSSRRADGSTCIKVLDFGISKIVTKDASGTNPALTKTSSLMGSPLYMSPEQLKSTRDVDARADIWALGVILHELLAGGPAFDASTMPQLCAAILVSPPAPLRAVRPDAPPGLEAVIQRCLEKEPAHRFQHVGEMAAALAPFAPPRALLSIDRVSRVTGLAPLHSSSSGSNPAFVPGVASSLAQSTPSSPYHPQFANTPSGPGAFLPNASAPRKLGDSGPTAPHAMGVLPPGAMPSPVPGPIIRPEWSASGVTPPAIPHGTLSTFGGTHSGERTTKRALFLGVGFFVIGAIAAVIVVIALRGRSVDVAPAASTAASTAEPPSSAVASPDASAPAATFVAAVTSSSASPPPTAAIPSATASHRRTVPRPSVAPPIDNGFGDRK